MKASHSTEPTLISSFSPLEARENTNPIHDHLLIVSKVVNTFSHSNQQEENIKDLASNDSSSLPEQDEDMSFCYFQKDIKLESPARREPSKSGSKPKKGRKSNSS